MRSKLIFRAEGNAEIGLGHLYRLLGFHSLINEMEHYFICSSESLTSFFSGNINLLECPKEITEELEWLKQRFNPEECILITDGYRFDLNYQSVIKKAGFALITIDDFLKESYQADIILNPAPIKETGRFKSHEAYGINYALLRKEFIQRAKNKRKQEAFENCFVSFGGSDFNNLSVKITRFLNEFDLFKEINVLAGLSVIDNLQKEFGNTQSVKIHQNLNAEELIEILDQCQIAVVPCSTISYEVSCCGLFLISGTYVDNQRLIYEGLKNNRLIFDAGDFNKLKAEKLKTILSSIMEMSDSEQKDYLQNQEFYFHGQQKEELSKLIGLLK